jgi:hypothetical protein
MHIKELLLIRLILSYYMPVNPTLSSIEVAYSQYGEGQSSGGVDL